MAFPSAATTRIIGPVTTCILTVGSGDSDKSPLTIVNRSESGVFQVTQSGNMKNIGGVFNADVDSITPNRTV